MVSKRVLRDWGSSIRFDILDGSIRFDIQDRSIRFDILDLLIVDINIFIVHFIEFIDTYHFFSYNLNLILKIFFLVPGRLWH